MGSDVEEHPAGVLQKGLDLLEEEGGFPAIDQTVVIGEDDVHHRTGLDVLAYTDRPVDDGVHAQDGRLGRVHNGGAHQRAKHSSVGNGEGATSHVIGGDLVGLALGSQGQEILLDFGEALVLAVAQHRHQETIGSSYGHRDVDVVPVEDVLAIDDGIQDRLFLHGCHTSLHEEGHEAEFDVVLLDELVLQTLPEVHDGAHVHFLEGGEQGVGVLAVLQALRDSLPHPAHRLPPLSSAVHSLLLLGHLLLGHLLLGHLLLRGLLLGGLLLGHLLLGHFLLRGLLLGGSLGRGSSFGIDVDLYERLAHLDVVSFGGEDLLEDSCHFCLEFDLDLVGLHHGDDLVHVHEVTLGLLQLKDSALGDAVTHVRHHEGLVGEGTQLVLHQALQRRASPQELHISISLQ